MKPTPQTQNQFPLTDYSYQATAEAVESATALAQKKIQTPQSAAFWKISSEYFGAEATLEYVIEAIFFAWISAVAAWPVAVMMHQLLRWMI